MFSALLFTGCRAERLVAGEYYSTSFSRSILRLDANSSFSFTSDNIRLAITGDNFFYSKGHWRRDKDTLILSSSKDTSNVARYKVSKELSDSMFSTFTFFSNAGDPISFTRVDKNNNLYRAIADRQYMSISELVQRGDTLTFYFSFGYKPVTIVIDDEKPRIYLVTVNREFRPEHFKNSKFKIRKNRLIELASGDTFKKKKNGM